MIEIEYIILILYQVILEIELMLCSDKNKKNDGIIYREEGWKYFCPVPF